MLYCRFSIYSDLNPTMYVFNIPSIKDYESPPGDSGTQLWTKKQEATQKELRARSDCIQPLAAEEYKKTTPRAVYPIEGEDFVDDLDESELASQRQRDEDYTTNMMRRRLEKPKGYRCWRSVSERKSDSLVDLYEFKEREECPIERNGTLGGFEDDFLYKSGGSGELRRLEIIMINLIDTLKFHEGQTEDDTYGDDSDSISSALSLTDSIYLERERRRLRNKLV